jgi:hypothetical protein
MDFADCLGLLRRRPSLPFIVAGSHAVAAHGFNHLLAFKLHLLKHSYRSTIQATDIEMLIRQRGLNLRSQEYEQLFLKYGTREIYETFCRVTRPDPGSGMVHGA